MIIIMIASLTRTQHGECAAHCQAQSAGVTGGAAAAAASGTQATQLKLEPGA